MKPERMDVSDGGSDAVTLVVRNINGQGVLFTLDGKEIGHQVKSSGHYWYEGHGVEREMFFRATFRVKGMKDGPPGNES